jgi:transcriptional regulator with XRE-family HTH domain
MTLETHRVPGKTKKAGRQNPVRVLREALHLTQRRFAERLGVSESYIQQVELGKKRLSNEVAARITVQFGMRPDSMQAERGEPKALLHARPGSLRHRVKEWQVEGGEDKFNEDAVAALRDIHLPKLVILFEAAVSKKRGMLAALLLDEAIEDLAERLQVTAAMKNRARLEGSYGEGLLDPYQAVVQQPDGWIRIDHRVSDSPKWVRKSSRDLEEAVQSRNWLKKKLRM